MTPTTFLHAGPPLPWARMSGPVRGAVIGALLYERLAETPEEAERLAESGTIAFDPCHHHASVGPMAGITTARMPVLVMENRTTGNRSYSTLNEGLGKALRYGAFAPDVVERLRWFEAVLGPALGEVLRRIGGVDIRSLIAQAVQMGDECHNRNRAASALLIKTIAPHVAALDLPPAERERILAFAAGNDHFFLNVGMAACKAALDAAHGVPWSSLVTVMARNGTEFGIRVSGLGDRWFTGPSGTPVGLYFAGFSGEDANPDMGDSAITETAGLGAFAMAGAPAIVQFVGGTPADALRHTLRMYEITLGESEAYRLPALGLPGDADRDRHPARAPDGDPAPDQHRHRPPLAGDRPDRCGARQSAAGLLRGGRPGAGSRARPRERDRESGCEPAPGGGRRLTECSSRECVPGPTARDARAAPPPVALVARGRRRDRPPVGGEQGAVRDSALQAPARPRDPRRIPPGGRGRHALAPDHGPQRLRTRRSRP